MAAGGDDPGQAAAGERASCHAGAQRLRGGTGGGGGWFETQAGRSRGHSGSILEAAIPLEKAPRVRSLEITDKVWYAATDQGLFRSFDQGSKWYGEPVDGEGDFIAVDRFADGSLTLVSPKRAFLSRDEGGSWTELSYPQYVTGLYNLTLVADGSLWLGTREGALHSTDGGSTWRHILGGLPSRHVFAVRYDEAGQRLLATALFAHGVFESQDGGRSWRPTPDAGVSIRSAMNYQGHLLAASTYNGLLLQQGETVESAHVGEGSPSAKRE